MSVFVCGPKRYVVGTKCLCKFPTWKPNLCVCVILLL